MGKNEPRVIPSTRTCKRISRLRDRETKFLGGPTGKKKSTSNTGLQKTVYYTDEGKKKRGELKAT